VPRHIHPELAWEFPHCMPRSVKTNLEAVEFKDRVVGQIVDPVNPPLPVPPPSRIRIKGDERAPHGGDLLRSPT